MRLSPIIEAFESDFRRQFSKQTLPRHHYALAVLKSCRSDASPMMKLQCNDCNKPRYLPHSCGHCHCLHCQHHASQVWIDKQMTRQVKASSSLITSTIPAEFRALFFTHQNKLYHLMFDCLWQPCSLLLKQIQLITQMVIPKPKPTQLHIVLCPCCGGEMRIVATRILPKQAWQEKTVLKKEAPAL